VTAPCRRRPALNSQQLNPKLAIQAQQICRFREEKTEASQLHDAGRPKRFLATTIAYLSALDLFPFASGQILDRLFVEFQFANLNLAFFLSGFSLAGDHNLGLLSYFVRGEDIHHTLRLGQRFWMARSDTQSALPID
jgi:hypothetical protein